MDSELDIEFSLPKNDGLEIWPLSMHCRTECNLVIWKAAEKKEIDWDEARKVIASLMDRLADLMHDYQKFGPFVALVYVPTKLAGWSELMGDQDWHRGRFVLQEVRAYRGQTIESAKERWLGSLHSTQYKPRKITKDDFFSALNTKLDTAKVPDGVDRALFNRYADNLMYAIQKGQPSMLSAQWQSELAANINNLLGKPVVEESSFGK